MTSLTDVNKEVISCSQCLRLIEYIKEVGEKKRRSFCQQQYWAKPVPGFGDAKARIWIVGLAPAAHGANRTGRTFTGDRSGDFLYAALFHAGLANQPQATHQDDGLILQDVYITTSARCAPPGNKPTPEELKNCFSHLSKEFQLFSNIQAILCLGKIAYDTVWKLAQSIGWKGKKKDHPFAHGACYKWPHIDFPNVYCSYHVSQQNTFTGKLTEDMFAQLLEQIKQELT